MEEYQKEQMLWWRTRGFCEPDGDVKRERNSGSLEWPNGGACYLCMVSRSSAWVLLTAWMVVGSWRWRLVSCMDWEKKDTTIPSIDRPCIKLIQHHEDTAPESICALQLRD